jgi:hypothetical protein
MVAKAGNLIEQGRVRSEELRSEVRAVVEALAAAVELCVDQGSLSAVM